MDDSFCASASERALRRHGKPGIFNTSEGTQYTGAAFTDDIMIERPWQSLKYGDIYIKEHELMKELPDGLRTHFEHHNNPRPHQTVKGKTPSEVCRETDMVREAAH